VRTLARASGINRGTTYDILKSLKDRGLVSYYHKATKQFFVAEDPSVLRRTVAEHMETLKQASLHLDHLVPELKGMINRAGQKPVVKYYEGFPGVKFVLSEVLDVSGQSPEKKYCVFSSAAIREYLYRAFPDFTKVRIRKKISIRSIGLGHAGTPAKLAEKKSLNAKQSASTYILVYPGKVAMISVSAAKEPLALIVEDGALCATLQQLFDFMWQALPS
jgi:sugar-specific transcriptional regulator TrmB